MKIEKPDWLELLNYGPTGFNLETESILDTWFRRNVEPVNKMLSEGVEVYSYENESGWVVRELNNSGDLEEKALLINIQPIVRETAEDVLRDYLETEEESIRKNGPYHNSPFTQIIERAKAVLNKGSDSE